MGSIAATTSKKVSFEINGKSVEAIEGSFLLTAIREAGTPVPTLCQHKDLKPNGNCRLCMVEVEQRGKTKFVTSCNFPIKAGIKVITDSEQVKKHRRLLAEMYLGRYPNVKVIKELAKVCGVKESRFTSAITDENSKACVLCSHCVRACHEFTQEDVLDFASRGINRHLTMPYGQVDRHCIGCTSCAYVCPTGAIEVVDDLNQPFDAIMIRDAGMKVNAEMAVLDAAQCRMREVGTFNIYDVMNNYDLLPCLNYQYGSHDDALKMASNKVRDEYLTQNMNDACWKGCSMSCAKTADNFICRTGPYAGQPVTVEGPEYETAAASANMGCFDPHFLLEFNFYCDTYGVDTISAGTGLAFVMECYEAGVIDKEYTGGLELNFGACDAVLEVLHQMAEGRGFGAEFGKGSRWLKEKWTAEGRGDGQFLHDIAMQVKGLEVSEYVSKESIAQQAGYAMANKGPQHDEAWLIFMDMVNNEIPTWEDKAEALYYFPMWRTWFGLMGLCKLPWNDVVPSGNKEEKETAKIPDHVRNYCRFVEGMTGKSVTIDDILKMSERVYNLQRVMNVKLGFGTRKDDYMPYRGMGPVTVPEYESRQERYDTQLKEIIGVDPAGKTTEEKMKILREYREAQYEQIMDYTYKRKGWTANGIPTVERLQELGIDLPEVVAVVKDRQNEPPEARPTYGK